MFNKTNEFNELKHVFEDDSQDLDLEIEHCRCRSLCWRFSREFQRKWKSVGKLSVTKLKEPRTVKAVQVGKTIFAGIFIKIICKNKIISGHFNNKNILT